MKRKVFFLLIIFFFTLAARFYLFDKIPGEWFGDISNVHEYEMQVLHGDRPFYFFQSPGPLYHYLIAPIALLYHNHGFETYKAASIAISILGLAATYLFVAEISTVTLALVTTLTMSFSLWFLIWSRLGNSQIVIPALVSFMSLFIVRYLKKRKLFDLLVASFIASLGWYTYPQTFIFPIVFFLFVVFYLFVKKKLNSQFKSLVIVIFALIMMVIPFVQIVQNDKGNFGPNGYVGEKVLPSLKLPIDQLIGKTLSNYQKVLFMLHVRGDKTFRVNVSGHSQLDNISGIFFLIGFLYFAKKKRKIWLFYIIWMLLLLPLPSISPAIPDPEIPNSARTIAVIPFVFLLVSAGFLWFSKKLIIFLHRYKFPTIILVSILYGYIVFGNLRLYFIDYVYGLPDRNLAPGKIIAEFIDRFSSDYSVYFASCCWGEAGEPENKGIMYQLKNKKTVYHQLLVHNCGQIHGKPAIIISSIDTDNTANIFAKCFTNLEIESIRIKDGAEVAKILIIR